jgi:para-nitrobenzyl esterase
VIVDTTLGKVEGLERAGVLQFRGVPYARADRFGPPQAPVPWTGVLGARHFGPTAPQRRSPMDALLGIDKQNPSEDCLFLNVFTPGADEVRRPVMVWIHGGGFTNGSGHVPFYNGTNLARGGDVVVVTLNYRLGVLGFLRTEHLFGARGVGESHSPGGAASTGVNGLRDQIAALRWVRDNIAGFGGDPDRVTVFGESAGGMSVTALLSAPEASGLIHTAIAQSGAGENVLSTDESERVTAEVFGRLGLDLTAAGARRLQDLPVEALLEAQTATEAGELMTGMGGRQRGERFLKLPFEPTVDGDLLPRRPLDAVRDGCAAGVPLVVGTTAEEWKMFMLQEAGGELADEQLARRAANLVGDDPAAVDELIGLYRQAKPDTLNRDLWSALMTDHVFRLPAVRLAEAQLPHGPVWMYRFDHPSSAFGGLAGACHTIDVPFVFDNVDIPAIEMLLGGVDDEVRRLAGTCATAWSTMARTGRPDRGNLDWPAYDLDRRATCILRRQPTVLDDPEGELRACWSD